MKNSKIILIIIGVLISVFLIGKQISANKNKQNGEVASAESKKVTIYKSPTCGCCVSYSGFLKGDNYEVEIRETEDMNSIKEKYNIPYSMQSCHTSIIGDYFVEGHVPLEVIDKLLSEKPDLDGIALPGMPAGSPGMPGLKTEEFVVYGLKDGQVSEFMRI